MDQLTAASHPRSGGTLFGMPVFLSGRDVPYIDGGRLYIPSLIWDRLGELVDDHAGDEWHRLVDPIEDLVVAHRTQHA